MPEQAATGSALAPIAPVYPFAPEHRADPYPVYRTLREGARVHWSEEQESFFFTHYEDCLAILRHPAGSTNMDNASMSARRTMSAHSPMAAMEAKPMLFADPPVHTRLRTLVSKAFTPRAVEAMRPHIAEIVDRLLDQAEANGELDIVADLAFPLPVIVIAEMLGVPVEDQDQLKPWSADLARTIDPVLTEETVAQAGMSALQFINYLNGLIEERRARPKDDLLSGLIAVEDEGERLGHDELLIMTMLLFVAGHETTQNLIGNGMLALLRHPEQISRLRDSDDPALAKNAVEEMLRYDSPVQLTGRHLMEDAEFGGTVVPKGYSAITLLAAANRDPDVFADPDRFDIERPNANRHIGFGQGIHFCLGAPLARAEAQIAVPALLRRFPELALPDDFVPAHRETFTLRGLTSLPVAI
ncbi:MAG: pimeloyl-[acyl-carrier protein] synthase [Acidimicrobiaceae bacterium]|nr:pimeloyl-[acyl-carrier protein] synthase [Acidimicrobiaceae bacterium]